MARRRYTAACLVFLIALTGCSPATPQVAATVNGGQQPAPPTGGPAPRAEPAGQSEGNAEESQAPRCPRTANGAPEITLRPTAGPIGTRVRISIPDGCFKRDWNKGYGIFLLRQFMQPRECELISGGGFKLHVNAAGGARGHLSVGDRGHCFQQPYGRAATPGRYVVGFGCHACGGPTFTITREP